MASTISEFGAQIVITDPQEPSSSIDVERFDHFTGETSFEFIVKDREGDVTVVSISKEDATELRNWLDQQLAK